MSKVKGTLPVFTEDVNLCFKIQFSKNNLTQNPWQKILPFTEIHGKLLNTWHRLIYVEQKQED